MIRQGDTRDWRSAIIHLRLLKGWIHQSDLAEAAGIDPGSVSDYELGLKVPSLRIRKKIAAAAGVSVAFLEDLVANFHGIRISFEAALGQPPAGEALEAAEPAPGLGGAIGGAIDARIAPFLLQLDYAGAEPGPRSEDHTWAVAIWAFLEPLPAEQQRKIAAFLQGERSWALAVRIALASEAMAADRADEALRLAELAVEIAEGVEPEAFQKRLLGWCVPFLGNSLRAGGKLNEARKAFAHADVFWEEGAAGDPAGLLDGGRRLDPYRAQHRPELRFGEVSK